MEDKLDSILKLGDPRLYEPSEPLKKTELTEAKEKAQLMAGLVAEFRKRYGAGRAIAAPQVGYMKRMIVVNIHEPKILINPELKEKSQQMIELWDDCMSFPNLLVRVKRHQSCRIDFLDENWTRQSWRLEGDLSELLQHECDHLDGILATQRALDDRSLAVKT